LSKPPSQGRFFFRNLEHVFGREDDDRDSRYEADTKNHYHEPITPVGTSRAGAPMISFHVLQSR
jgi:hypothetical protein